MVMTGRLSVDLIRGCGDGLDIPPTLSSACSCDSIPLTSSPLGPRSIPCGPRPLHPGSIPLPSDGVGRASNPLASDALGPLPTPSALRNGLATGSLITTVARGLGAVSAAELSHAPEPRPRPF